MKGGEYGINTETKKYLYSVKRTKGFKNRISSLLPILSLLVVIVVFWWLKLIGITMAGEAFCGKTEHSHTDECYSQESPCNLAEHIHTGTCYSNFDADLETTSDWEKTLSSITYVKSSSQNLVSVATSQLGYTESKMNFKIGDDGVRRGYTRYGQWFGNPYGEWSTMFTSFCIRYAGMDSVPISAGAEAMRIKWKAIDLYFDKSDYTPVKGDIVFLDTDQNGTVDSTAIITESENGFITVIGGDIEDAVSEKTYSLESSSEIIGYGISSISSRVTVIGNIYSDAANTVADTGGIIAQTVSYNTNIFNSGSAFVVYTRGSNGRYYAIDGNGRAVEIFIDAGGNVTSNVDNPDSILWTFEYCGTENSSPTYYIQNVSKKNYLHPYHDNNTSHGAVLTGRWESALIQRGNGVNIKGARQANGYASLSSNTAFTDTSSSGASVFYFAREPEKCTVWIDGTNGGLRSLVGSPDTAFRVNYGDIIKLPTEWESPKKYEYTVRGWYDVKNGKYYPLGAEVPVTENMLFYADWVAASYDIGAFNDKTVNTVSTNEFITTKIFDYNVLFNALSANSSVNITSSGHSETWNILQNGTLATGNNSLDFIFVDYDAGGDISYPGNRDMHNNSQDNATTGIYDPRLIEILFGTDNSFDPETGTGVLGKNYLGTGDFLFQFDSDPNGKHYGYYYYDSRLNAASYNQSEQRFYVYNYLERTSDTARDGDFADFLPLNSPYANTNGQNDRTYTYNGDYGEYSNGTLHHQYDSKYEGGDDLSDKILTNYWFGMSIELNFFLPDNVGSGGNKDIFGSDMHFHFSGDDDVWILLDGELVLDIGGIHGISDGDINFSTGIITREGSVVGNLADFGVKAGEHTLEVYYLERGSSRSNCEFYFNLAPRYDFQIRKEDVLTSEVLNGAEFSVYMDKNCTVPAELWTDKKSYENGEASTNVFAVENGLATMWGMTSGRIYYIKETKPPDKEGYSLSSGIICLTLDHKGYASYTVEIAEDENGEISPGYTVHGLKVDIEKQEAYVVVTNAEDWVKEVTSVEVSKKWNDSLNHKSDLPIFYLTVKDPDGTVRRIRQVKLGVDNGWKYIWTNLPKYYVDEDGNTAEAIEYKVEEAFFPGYQSSITKVDKTTSSGGSYWAEAYQFENGEKYILKSQYGCIGTESPSNPLLVWINEDAAKTSGNALWTATVNSDGTVIFQNQHGYYLHLSYRGGGVGDSIFTGTTEKSHINMKYKQVAGQGIKIYHQYGESWNNESYYISRNILQYNGIYSTNEQNGVIFTPMVEKTDTIVVEDGTFVYSVENTPLTANNTTSVTVKKEWDLGIINNDLYRTYQVPVTLYADGYNTGLEGILNLQNGWTVSFEGLPFKDSEGNIINYTIKESWNESGWDIIYGSMNYSSGNPGSYSATITNRNRAGYGVELPATGGYGAAPWTFAGAVISLSSFIGGCILRRKRERRLNFK